MSAARIAVGFMLALGLAFPLQAQQKPASKPSSGKPVARMYKCVDTAGKVYYSDKLTPDCGNSKEMSRHGLLRSKPQDQAQPAKPGKPDPGKTTAAESDRRDRALLATYTTEQEIDAARDRNIGIPQQTVNATEKRLNKSSTELAELKKQADVIATQKKPIPAHLLDDINRKQTEIANLEKELAQKKALVEDIRSKFESDKQRFRELNANKR